MDDLGVVKHSGCSLMDAGWRYQVVTQASDERGLPLGTLGNQQLLHLHAADKDCNAVISR